MSRVHLGSELRMGNLSERRKGAVKCEVQQRMVPVLDAILMQHVDMFGSVHLNVQKGRLVSVEVVETHNATAVEAMTKEP